MLRRIWATTGPGGSPVISRDKRLVRICSLDDFARNEEPQMTRAPLGVSQPGGLHSQKV